MKTLFLTLCGWLALVAFAVAGTVDADDIKYSFLRGGAVAVEIPLTGDGNALTATIDGGSILGNVAYEVKRVNGIGVTAYTVTLSDENAIALANATSSSTSDLRELLSKFSVIDGDVTMTATNIGSGKTATVTVFFTPMAK